MRDVPYAARAFSCGFMQEIPTHATRPPENRVDDAIAPVAAEVAGKNVKTWRLSEMQIRTLPIGDDCRTPVRSLFSRCVVVVTTSNGIPDDL